MKSLNCYSLKTFIFSIIVCIYLPSNCQNSSINYNNTATILSSACPGLGQIFNKKYWKVPLIYAALGTTMYYYIDNNEKYQEYKLAYIARNDNDPNTLDNFLDYSSANLVTLKDYYRNSRDAAMFLFILTYFLNIVDASVDTHFLNYNLNDDLSINLKPGIFDDLSEQINVSLKYNF